MPDSGGSDPLQDAADQMAESVRECVAAAQSSLEAARAGTYDAKRLREDIGAAWARSVRDGARLVTSAVRVAEHLATQGPEPAAGDENDS